MAERLQTCLRQTDMLCRLGGDEFVIILMGSTPEVASETVMKRLQLMLDGELSLKVGETNIPIRGSIGAFPYDPTISPFENLKEADELMRIQKLARKAAITQAAVQNPITL